MCKVLSMILLEKMGIDIGKIKVKKDTKDA
jgi:hypothetical protein